MTKLADFRADAPAPKPLVEVLAEEVPFRGRMLAFDQSLADGGWAYMVFGDDGVQVRRTGNIRTVADEKGHEGNLKRSVDFFHAVEDLLREFDPELVAHESPPVANNKMARPESSLMSAEAIRISASLNDMPIYMVHSQRVKKHITGNGNAKKTLVAKMVKERMPELQTNKPGPLNEGVYDAIGVGLTTALEYRTVEV